MAGRTSGRRSDHFAALSWKEFESYVIDLLDRLYAPHGLHIRPTPYTNDGGRDGYACLTIGPPETSGRGDPLALSLSIWAEVKKRGRAVDLGDIGGHFILAVDARVNKLIFITDSHFTEVTREACLSVARRSNIQVAFLTGEDLVDLERRLVGPAIPESAKQLEPKADPGIALRVRLTTSLDYQLTALPPDLIVDCGEVFYLIAEVIAGPCASAAELTLTARPSKGLHVTALASTTVKIDPVGGQQRVAFAIWGDHSGRFEINDLGLRADVSAPGRSLKVDQFGGVRIHRPLLIPDLTRERSEIVEEIARLFGRVGTDVSVATVLLEAAGGGGKSHLLRALRRRFLPRGVRELRIEGETHRGLGDVFKSLFFAAAPIGNETFAHVEPEAFEAWVQAGGFSPESGPPQAVLRGLLTGDPTAATIEAAVALAAAALAHASRHSPIIVTFEDLHKVSATVLEFLQRLAALLSHRKGGTVLFILTSRSQSEELIPEHATSWGRAFSRLQGTAGLFAHFRLPSLTHEEAVGLLRKSVSGLGAVEGARLVEHTGTTPFELREALNYLHTIDVISVSSAAGAYVADAHGVSRVLDSPVLKSATRARLDAFIATQPSWLGAFILMGACLGAVFRSATVETALDLPADQLEGGFEALQRFEIMRPARMAETDGEDIAFDHDLIRDAVLNRAGRAGVRLAAAKLAPYLPDETPIRARLVILLMAGALDAAATAAEVGLKAAQLARNAVEGLEFALARLYALLGRADAITSNGFLQQRMAAFDRGLLFAAPPERKRRQEDRRGSEPIILALEQMTATGVMEDELATRLITLGQLEAEAQDEPHERARLRYFDGRRLFAQAHYLEAFQQFAAAEASWPEGRDARSTILSEIRLRIAICERHLGREADAHATMLRALNLRCGIDWPLLQSVVANLGAFVMYDDQALARRYWRRGLRVARRSEDVEQVAHFTNDLAHLDLMIGDFDAAKRGLTIGRALAERHGSVKEAIRADILFGCLALSTGDLATARRALSQAEEQAISHSNFRRLWRIRANLATLAELEGDLRLALVRDLQSLRGMPSVGEAMALARKNNRFTRELCALVNMALRSRIHREIYDELWTQVGGAEHSYFIAAAEALDTGQDVRNWLGGLTCLLKPVGDGGHRRFLITE